MLPTAITQCAGRFSVDVAPGVAAGQWDIVMAKSFTMPGSAQTCTQVWAGGDGTRTGTLCSVDEANQTCSWAATGIAVNAGECLTVKATINGTPTTDAGHNFSLECSSTAAAQDGGPVFYATDATSVTDTFTYGPVAAGTATNQTYFSNPGNAISACAGSLQFTTGTPAKSWTVTMIRSDVGLDNAATWDCATLVADASTSTSTLCTIQGHCVSGTNNAAVCVTDSQCPGGTCVGDLSCAWPATAFAVPKNGCFAVKATASSSGMTNPGVKSLVLNCAQAVPTVTPTPTVTATPTLTATPNGRPQLLIMNHNG
jgi:hypothetical protein